MISIERMEEETINKACVNKKNNKTNIQAFYINKTTKTRILRN